MQALRQKKLLSGIEKSMHGLEIGASFNPVAPKAEGWNVRVLDHLSQEGLKEKYKDHPVDCERIEPVDFVCADGDYLRAIPGAMHSTFDYIVASHAIEHFPDLLGFLITAERLLAPGGVLALVVPDKRFCFDFFRPLSTTADILYAHYEQRKAHGKRTAFEHVAYAVANDGKIAWAHPPANCSRFTLCHHLQQAEAVFNDTPDDGSGGYTDFHNWKFTPASLRLILLELQMLGRTRLFTLGHSNTKNGEFYLQLKYEPERALPPDAHERRLKLMSETVRELAQSLSPWRRGVIPIIKSLLPPSVAVFLAPYYHGLRRLYHKRNP